MNTVILLAAGKSKRAGLNKLFADVWGKPLWTLAYQTFLEHPEIDEIILVVSKDDDEKFKPHLSDEKTKVVHGGATRMQSFNKGLRAIGRELGKEDIIIDHNAANPNVTMEEISNVLEAARLEGAAAVSHPAVDTLLTVADDHYAGIIDRSQVRLMQTPQAVRGDILKDIPLTDETDLTSALISKVPIRKLEAHPANRKMTYEEDLACLSGEIYFGEDSHRFSDSGELILGGLKIPDFPALQAASDGDVILHAIGRALAQAKNQSFSEEADAAVKQGRKDSAIFLKKFLQGLKIFRLSVNLEGKKPHLDSLARTIRASLACILQIEPQRIHISAMSGEELTPFGRGEGLRCTVILTVLKQ